MVELKTDFYAIKVLQPFVVVIVCNKKSETFECKTKITESFVKKCISKALTNYILGGD